jgi:hypothetical protein
MRFNEVESEHYPRSALKIPDGRIVLTAKTLAHWSGFFIMRTESTISFSMHGQD